MWARERTNIATRESLVFFIAKTYVQVMYCRFLKCVHYFIELEYYQKLSQVDDAMIIYEAGAMTRSASGP